MYKSHRSPVRYRQISSLKPFLQNWRTTENCRTELLNLKGIASLPSNRELAGSLLGDPRIMKRYVPTPGENEWKWKDEC